MEIAMKHLVHFYFCQTQKASSVQSKLIAILMDYILQS